MKMIATTPPIPMKEMGKNDSVAQIGFFADMTVADS